MKAPGLSWLLVLAALASGLVGVRGYYIADATRIWPDGNITVHEHLPSTGTLIDGSASLNVAFENALQTWNQYLGRVQLVPVRGSTVTPGDGDRVNNVFLAATVFDMPFETGTLAITNRWYGTTTNLRTEFDITFNSAYTWNSYRGPRRTGVHDLFRVALRQLGRGLGLDAPDLNGQTVEAIMNFESSDLDTLTFDDIAGITSLYSSAASAPAPSNPLQVQQFTAQTDGDGIATFSPTGGRSVPVRFADEDTGAGIPGANAYLFTDPNGIAVVALNDPYRRYFSQMAPIRLPLIVTNATTPAGVRPIEVPVPLMAPSATESTMSVAVNWMARAALDAWTPVQQRAVDFMNAAQSNGFIIDRQIPLSALTDVTMSGYLSGESRDRSLGIMVEARGYADTMLWKGFERVGAATALRDGFWNVVRFGLTEGGYREDQQFRVRVARIVPVDTPEFLRGFNEWQIYVSPSEAPRGDVSCERLGVGCPVPGVLNGRLYDVTSSGRSLGGVIKLNGTREVLLFAGANGLYASQPIPPGLYSVTAQSRNYRSKSLHLDLAGDGRITTLDFGLIPIGIRSIAVTPATQTIRDSQVTSFRATAYGADTLPYAPTPRFTWHSDNPAAATVDPQTGDVRAVRAGVAHITAQADQMTSNVATLTVERSVPCTYAVTPSGYTSTSAGGTGTFTVTTDSDCTWTAASLASYITITSSTAGAPGSGTVRFSVAASTSTSQRVGSLLIATRTVSITQAGTTPTPTPSPTPAPSGGGMTYTRGDFKCTFNAGGIVNSCAGSSITVNITARMSTGSSLKLLTDQGILSNTVVLSRTDPPGSVTFTGFSGGGWFDRCGGPVTRLSLINTNNPNVVIATASNLSIPIACR